MFKEEIWTICKATKHVKCRAMYHALFICITDNYNDNCLLKKYSKQRF